MTDDFNSEIDALLAEVKDETDSGISELEPAGDRKFDMNAFSKKAGLFGSDSKPVVSGKKSIHEVDLSVKQFDEITEFVSEFPSEVFEDKTYYKTALTGENQSAQRVHMVLSKYLTCTDPKDRAVFRQQIIMAYWELIRGMAPKMSDVNLPMPKRMMFRFGVLLPSLFRPEQKEFFSKIFYENRTGEPVLYMDEWFMEIASGRLSNSMTDEKRTPHKASTPEEAASMEQTRLQQLQQKNSGKLQSAENLLNMKENERTMLELELKDRVEILCTHNPIMGAEPHTQPYSESQQKLFSEITDRLHRLSKNGKELARCLKDYQDAKAVY